MRMIRRRLFGEDVVVDSDFVQGIVRCEIVFTDTAKASRIDADRFLTEREFATDPLRTLALREAAQHEHNHAGRFP